jgi:GntR family transcriptional repressor for pyruvate dehydrogenase complex
MKAITKTPIINQVVDTIKESIISGEFNLGSKLPSELSLCETLSVSRSTIREAFKVLQTLGYVELKPGRGAFVSDVHPHDINAVRLWFKESAPRVEDFTEIREAIEPLAIKKAIEHCDDADLPVLENLNKAFKRAARKQDVAEMAKLDESFHGKIFSMTNNSILMKFNDIIAAEYKKYRLMAFEVPGNGLSALGCHTKIVEAIKRRDVADGLVQMANHLKLVITDMEKIIADG